MSAPYKYSKKAEADLIKIYQDTFLEWGSAQADKYDKDLHQTVLNLASNPKMGKECDWIKLGYRKFGCGRHVIFYKVRSKDIFITRILHGHMNFEEHL